MDLNGPALQPPEGVTPNFDNPPNNNRLAYIVLTLCAVVATICLLLRLYARVILLRKIQIEEVLITLAYGPYWGAVWSAYRMIETPGYFVHQWDLRLKDLIPANYYTLVFGVCYSIILPLLKVSILVEWLRVFSPRGSRYKGLFWWGCIIVIFVQSASGVAIAIALNFQCTPHKKIYDFSVHGTCWELYKVQVSSASIQLASDVAIMLLPQHVIWKLKMSWQKRLGVSIVFGFGLTACVSAAFRLETTVAHAHTSDAIYSLAPLVFWATAEITCGFFIVCLPCIPKTLKETGMMDKIKRAFGYKASSQYNHNENYYPGSGRPSHHAKLSTTGSDSYHKLAEEGVVMNNIKGFASTERLHDGVPGDGITRTTRITVSQNPRLDVDDVDRRVYP
ncbi:hypothetical protein BGW36DRAFT_412363 [Talaromyces proteolyticus]|uniref:Rhodopsin domain-containing protein n=1 Tax=Talaromyces proteolyticus TaxID=1131652 RepID=A0AAD4KF28_9EURO|nr:uncharacterized protein BGW36DRAFT_412363 [Talaromyces proteolyticus]KAH8689592.1 hypothetical protein BGW36DRAFT_412363 [Talaromyces proteolyticus]